VDNEVVGPSIAHVVLPSWSVDGMMWTSTFERGKLMARTSSPIFETFAEVLHSLGNIAPERVYLDPKPGTATERDLLRAMKKTDRLLELVDGTIVEKVMGSTEGGLAADIIHLLRNFLDHHDLGDVLAPDTTMRLMPKLVRLPDVAFVRWEQYPDRQRPTKPIPDIAPDLAVEVLSKSNTTAEMERKLKEYFLAGASLVWLVDPATRTVEACTPDHRITLTEEETLDGGDVLPGLRLSVREVFARTPPIPLRRRGKKQSNQQRKPRRNGETR
jgi:Uma2 family endonuclease